MHKKQQELMRTVMALRHTSEEIYREADKQEAAMDEMTQDNVDANVRSQDYAAFDQIEKMRKKAEELEETVYKTLAKELFDLLQNHVKTHKKPDTEQFMYDTLAEWYDSGLLNDISEQTTVVKYALEVA